MSCDEITGCVKEDSGFAVMARVQVDGTNWTQAGVSAITWKAWDINDKSAAYTSGTLVVGTVSGTGSSGRVVVDEDVEVVLALLA